MRNFFHKKRVQQCKLITKSADSKIFLLFLVRIMSRVKILLREITIFIALRVLCNQSFGHGYNGSILQSSCKIQKPPALI